MSKCLGQFRSYSMEAGSRTSAVERKDGPPRTSSRGYLATQLVELRKPPFSVRAILLKSEISLACSSFENRRSLSANHPLEANRLELKLFLDLYK